MKKRMLSGIKPSGQLHIGNYIGALNNFVKYQDEYEMIVFIANLHCITVYQDPKELQKNLTDAIALYLAVGLDPQKATIFLQSDVMEHAQLGFILQCNSYLGELNRMTQYKDKVIKGEQNLTVGLYTYPDLMAADILIYGANYVPVGVDQKQHVELARDIAIRMNNKYEEELFVIPTPLIEKVGSKIYSLQDPTSKMSKSDKGEKGLIYLLDDPKKARKKIMSAVTDSFNKVQYDPLNQPGISNLIVIAATLSDRSVDEVLLEVEDMQYGQFKKYVADIVVNKLETIQKRYHDIIESGIISKVLADGAKKASQMASPRLKKVQHAIGLEIEKNND